MLTQYNDFYNKLFVNILLIHRLEKAFKETTPLYDFFEKNLKNVLTKTQAYDIILGRQENSLLRV